MGTANGIHCGKYSFCARCEKCICQAFIHKIEEWFTSMSYQQKMALFLGLLKRCSTTLVTTLLSSVRNSDGKERIYSMSKPNPSLNDIDEPALRNIFAHQDANMSMIEVFLQFLTFTDYQKKMALLHLFKISDDRLLANLSSQMYNIVVDEGDIDLARSKDDSEQTSSSENEEIDMPSRKPVFEKYDLDDVHDMEPLSNYESEDDGFATELNSTQTRPISSSTKASKRKKVQVPTSLFNDKSGKDFISAMPVGMAKKIFGFLDEASLANCLCVSPVWRQLVEDVRTELRIQYEVRESAELIQVTAMGTTGQLCNHRYARFTDVLVPNFDPDTGECIIDNRPKPVDESSPIYLEGFKGISTRRVIMEERNVYCGPFNVMVVHDRVDKHRVLHNDGGKLVAVGSFNRLISLHDLTTGQELNRVLEGHSGSIRCIRISLSDGLVFSGSYDTGIRVWNLSTGRFTKVFNGHQSTILCLGYENQLIVSGSADRTCRVWSLKSLKCIRKFYHRSAVTAVAMRTAYLEERIFSGDFHGHIKVWNLRTGHLIKVLHGHQAEVTSIDIDRWFIISGSKDNYVMGWSNQGDHRRCLFAFNHPNHVLSVSLRYLRVISGCADGRIRIWSVIDGSCIKVLRGNSRNDPVLSLDCRGSMITVNTESNVILLKFEPVKFNYTTSELYLPNASLKAQNARYIAGSDSESENVESQFGRPSRPHSAVRATRMHLLKCASREISGSRASFRSSSHGSVSGRRSRKAVSTQSLDRLRSDSSNSRSNSRPNTSPTRSRRRRKKLTSRSAKTTMQSVTYLPDPQDIATMLDHRSYPLRYRDLEEARRIQLASTLPPWRKEEVDEILKDVRLQHRKLVEKRQEARRLKAENKRLGKMNLIDAINSMEGTGTGSSDGGSDQDDSLDDLDRLRLMSWSFHGNQPTKTKPVEGRGNLKEAFEYNPPTLQDVKRTLRNTLNPGARPPDIPYVRVAVAETMRQDRDELVKVPPLRISPSDSHGNLLRASSFSLRKTPGKQEAKARLKEEQSKPEENLRSILIEHKRLKEIEARKRRGGSSSMVRQVDETSYIETVAAERQRLLDMAEELEMKGWNDSQSKQFFIEKNLVSVQELPSPVVKSVFKDSVSTSIPKPVEVRIRNQNRPKSSPIKIINRPQKSATRPVSEPSGEDPLMKIPNFEQVLSNLHSRVDSIKVKQESISSHKARNISESSSGIMIGGRSPDESGHRQLVLHNPSNYEQQTAEVKRMNERDTADRQRKLDVWRRKKWSLLAKGQLTPKQLHN